MIPMSMTHMALLLHAAFSHFIHRKAGRMNSWIHDVNLDDSYGILIKHVSLSLLRLEAAMKTEKENMRSTLDSILAKVDI